MGGECTINRLSHNEVSQNTEYDQANKQQAKQFTAKAHCDNIVSYCTLAVIGH